jgi:cytidylate kinase
MGIITISRTFGSGGTFIAKELARRLGYDYLDRELIHKNCVERKDNVCAFGTEDEKAYPFLSKITDLMSNRSFYKPYLMATIYSCSLKNNVIIIGVGANIFLAGAPDIMNIQVVMPFSERIKTVSAKLDIGINEALEIVKKRDDEKKEFLKSFFDKDINDPTIYHMVINAARIAPEDGVEIIASYCKKRFPPELSPETRQYLAARLLEKRAELLLHWRGISHNFPKVTFEGREEGVLLVKGVIGREDEKKQLFDALGLIREVRKIEDQVKIGTVLG